MIHVDIKQLDRFKRAGHRINSDRRLGSPPGSGYGKTNVAVDDAICSVSTGLPLREIDLDNDPAFMNALMELLCDAPEQGIEITSSRGYRRKDKAWGGSRRTGC